MKIRVGSRDSRPAVSQSEMVMESIRWQNPDAEVDLVTMKTTGDLILDRTLDKVGGKGLFVKELDRALLDGRVDLTVHSYKDMPMELTPGLPVVAVSRREDPRDVLVLPEGSASFDGSKPIGCSSLRRTIQLRELFPGVEIKPVRGNVQTRLNKLDSGEYGALVLALAGLRRLGLEHRVGRVFSTEELLPAACQGILAVQAREGFDASVLDGFHDKDAWIASQAERSFVRALDGGCSSPVAAYAEVDGGTLRLTGMYVDEAGKAWKETREVEVSRAEEAGRELAESMKSRVEHGT